MAYDPTTGARIQQAELARMRAESQRVSQLSREQLLSEQANQCPHCGQTIEPKLVEYEVFGEIRRKWMHYPKSHGCAQEMVYQVQHKRDTEVTRQAQAEIDRHKRLERAGLSGLIETYTFDRYADRTDWPASATVRARVKAYAYAITGSTLNGKPWLVLHGAYGTGKSHLAAAVVRFCLEAGWNDVAFRVWTSTINRLQATMDKTRHVDDEFGHETQADILAELKRGSVVAIDDIDKQPATEWTRSKLFDVINTRYNQLTPTILTFNTSLEDRLIQDYIGAAVLDRIMQHAYDIVEFTGPSYRMVMA
jgi:DNA replication protein DnaC